MRRSKAAGFCLALFSMPLNVAGVLRSDHMSRSGDLTPASSTTVTRHLDQRKSQETIEATFQKATGNQFEKEEKRLLDKRTKSSKETVLSLEHAADVAHQSFAKGIISQNVRKAMTNVTALLESVSSAGLSWSSPYAEGKILLAASFLHTRISGGTKGDGDDVDVGTARNTIARMQEIEKDTNGEFTTTAAVDTGVIAGAEMIRYFMAGNLTWEGSVLKTIEVVGPVLVAAVGAFNPALGLAASLGFSFFQAIILDRQEAADPYIEAMKKMETRIMENMKVMISRSTMRTEVQNRVTDLASISEELNWMPILLEKTDSSTRLLFDMMIQHEVAKISYRIRTSNFGRSEALDEADDQWAYAMFPIAFEIELLQVQQLMVIASYDENEFKDDINTRLTDLLVTGIDSFMNFFARNIGSAENGAKNAVESALRWDTSYQWHQVQGDCLNMNLYGCSSWESKWRCTMHMASNSCTFVTTDACQKMECTKGTGSYRTYPNSENDCKTNKLNGNGEKVCSAADMESFWNVYVRPFAVNIYYKSASLAQPLQESVCPVGYHYGYPSARGALITTAGALTAESAAARCDIDTNCGFFYFGQDDSIGKAVWLYQFGSNAYKANPDSDPTFLPCVKLNPASWSGLIYNGGFERGLDDWTQTTGSIVLMKSGEGNCDHIRACRNNPLDWGSPEALHGSYFVNLHGSRAPTLTLTKPLGSGRYYTLSWYESKRRGYQSKDLAIKVNGVEVGMTHTVGNVNPTWARGDLIFEGSTTTVIQFISHGSLDGSIFLDDISVELACTDTASWQSGTSSHNCDKYKSTWCDSGAAKPGQGGKLGKSYNFPEQNCCTCGKIHWPKVTIVDKGASGCTTSSPCGQCEGDCDSDSDCSGSLKCFQRTTSTQVVPGCAKTGYVKSSSDHDYCYYEAHPCEKNKGSGGPGNSPECCTVDNPCPAGVGDCNTDDQCQGTLVCGTHDQGVAFGYQNNAVDVCSQARPSIGDCVRVNSRDSSCNCPTIGNDYRIVQDDQDSRPYRVTGCNCYLRESQVTASTNCQATCYTTGPSAGSGYMYGDIGGHVSGIASASACHSLCQQDSDCGVFVYKASTQNCWKKCSVGINCATSINGATAVVDLESGFMAGPKLCQASTPALTDPTPAPTAASV